VFKPSVICAELSTEFITASPAQHYDAQTANSVSVQDDDFIKIFSGRNGELLFAPLDVNPIRERCVPCVGLLICEVPGEW